ncbi:MAG: DUF1294 domain-containing protein [Oscillospiraceae bacterium]|nr:DUF1294 domain-containing protein [Oscillospiraceae bacterium]
MDYIVIYLILINALSFLLMLVDKYKAQNNLWRIPEATLLTVAAIGGSFGCFGAMKACHHKTKHQKFSIGVPVMMVIHSLIIWDLARLL